MGTTTTDIPSLLIVDDKESIRSLLQAAFLERGYFITMASDGEEAIELIQDDTFDVIITDLKMPKKTGLDVLKAAKAKSPDTEVIVVTAYGALETAVEAMRLGAYDFISKPFKLAELELKVDKILHERPPKDEEFEARTPGERHIVGESAHTKQLLKLIKKIGNSRSSVLITGPTGTGKELVARALHANSPLRDRPFVTLNCAALAPGVLESELFGHEKGAFTGAVARRIGRFEQAHTGTLFLDEVGDIDVSVQTKLLRVLQEGEIERVGGAGPIKVDVRVLAATNRDLRQAIAVGAFREDFYYRLNVFSIQLEPLRNRRDDLSTLVEHFLKKFSQETGKELRGVDAAVERIFARYSWPGNIRELENVLERAAVLADGPVITVDELPHELIYAAESADTAKPAVAAEPSAGEVTLHERTDRMESDLIREALERFRWNKTKTAAHLGLKRTTLQYKIKKYGLE